MGLFWNWEAGMRKSEGGHFRAIKADYGLQKIMEKNRFFKEVIKSTNGKKTQKDPQRAAKGTR